VKKIVQRLTGKILPSPSNFSISTIHTRIVRESLAAVPSLFCCFYGHGVIFLYATCEVEPHTA
jgi:hypothetical protein